MSRPVRKALLARTVRLLEQLERDEYPSPEPAALLAELRPLVAEPEPMTNSGKAYDGIGVDWRGEQ